MFALAGRFFGWADFVSLEKKSIHIRIPPELHEQLSVMAEFLDKDIAEEGARILARGIVAAFYDFKISHERMTRLGLGGKGRE